MYELRDYQADAVEIIYNFLNSGEKKSKDIFITWVGN